MANILAFIVVGLVGYYVVKGYKAQVVLLAGGIVMMFLAIFMGLKPPFADGHTTGSLFLDTIDLIRAIAAKQSAGLGLKIMAIAGFAFYMAHIGASDALVRVLTSPLERVAHRPYIFLAACFVVGEILSIFITSASGLGVLLMVTMYPLMRHVGLSPVSSAAPIATSVAIEMGPGQGNVNFAAELMHMDVVDYVVTYQGILAPATLIAIGMAHIIVQSTFDKKDGWDVEKHKGEKVQGDTGSKTEGLKDAPTYYALLPVIPLVLIFVFSKLVVDSIKMKVSTAMFISLMIAMAFQIIKNKGDVKRVFAEVQVFFDGMGYQFANVVTFIVAGQIFAQGLMNMGVIDSIITTAQSSGLGATGMMVVFVLIIMIVAVLIGSGNAAFFSFAHLAPTIASSVGVHPSLLLVPMQFVAGMARNISPIAPNMVAISGVAGISPFDLAKRTSIPMVVGIVTTVIISIIIT